MGDQFKRIAPLRNETDQSVKSREMNGVYLEAALMHSQAFRELSIWSVRVYLRFLQKRVMVKDKHKSRSSTYRITNNGEIIFTYREALKMGISERNFRNSLDQLQRVGFLDIVHYGKGGSSGESTLYLIDTRWKHYGTEHFEPPKKPRIKVTRQGSGWAAYNTKKKQNELTIMTAQSLARLSEDQDKTAMNV